MEPERFEGSLARAMSKLDPELHELRGIIACVLRRRTRSGRTSVTATEAAFCSAACSVAFGEKPEAKTRAAALGRRVLIGC